MTHDPLCPAARSLSSSYIFIAQEPKPRHSSSFASNLRKSSSIQQTLRRAKATTRVNNMACWSAENATKAYLSTLKMGQKCKEPDVAEFISALAAGNNAQLMVVACGGAADSTTLALVAAANQTGGKVICIVPSHEELRTSKISLGRMASHQVQFMVGEAQEVLLEHYDQTADFVLIDCNLENHEEILRAVQEGRKQNGTVVVGYNAFSCRKSCLACGSKTQLLPIGGGLLVTRFGVSKTSPKYGSRIMGKVKSRWVVKVDKCTGEEHVFRVRFPQRKVVQA